MAQRVSKYFSKQYKGTKTSLTNKKMVNKMYFQPFDWR